MNPYFKPPRYKKHVNEPQTPTQFTKHNARTHQPPSTRPSSQLDAPTQPPVKPVQLTTLTTPAQPSTHQAQLVQPDQTTEPYQTTIPTSTKNRDPSHPTNTNAQTILSLCSEVTSHTIKENATQLN